MLPRDRGAIIQVGSALAYRGIPLQSADCAAKHAVQGFCDSLRLELLHDHGNVKLTMVQMPALNTPQFDWVKSRLPRRLSRCRPFISPKWRPRPSTTRPIIIAASGTSALHRRGHCRQQDRAGGRRLVLGPAGIRRPTVRRQTRSELAEQSQMPVDADKDYGAHGDFDALRKDYSLQVWADQGRDWILLAGAAGRCATPATTASARRGAAGWPACCSGRWATAAPPRSIIAAIRRP